jgi:ATP synthase F1 complex assembly factor 2
MIMRRAPSWAVTALSSSRPSTQNLRSSSFRCFQCASRPWAVAHPITAHGPPPKAPKPSPDFGDRVERRKKQEELMKEASSQASHAKYPLKKRFWKDVHVKESDGEEFFLSFPPAFYFLGGFFFWI